MWSVLTFRHIFNSLLDPFYPPDYTHSQNSLFTAHNKKHSRSQNRLKIWKQVCCQFCISKLLWVSFLLKHHRSMGCLSHVRPARSPRCKGISLSLSSTVFLFFLSLFLYLFLTTEGPSLLHFTCRRRGKGLRKREASYGARKWKDTGSKKREGEAEIERARDTGGIVPLQETQTVSS